MKLSKRIWLNPKDSTDTGAIHWQIEQSDDSEIYAAINIWDCGKKVSLNFDCGITSWSTSPAERAKKIDLMVGALQEFKAAMGKAYANLKEVEKDD